MQPFHPGHRETVQILNFLVFLLNPIMAFLHHHLLVGIRWFFYSFFFFFCTLG